MLAAFQWETYKLLRRPAVWVCVAILLALAVVLGYVISYLLFTHPPPGSNTNLPRGASLSDLKVVLYPINFVKQTLSQWSTLGGVFALILGVLSQGSEYGWGTVKTLYTQRPGRIAMLAGKLLALLLLVLVMVLGLFAVDALASFGIASIDGKSTNYPAAIDIVKGLAATWLIFSFWATFGFALATVFRQSAMAIGLGLAYAILIEGIILGLLSSVGGDVVKQIQSWFPIANTGYLTEAFGTAGPNFGRAAAKPYADANHAVLVLLGYLIVFTFVSAFLVSRRDVT
jgi:ABC-type transport system involved in multi-copper enzyme maturation permease subunit